MSFHYLASPYTHPDPAVMQQRFEAAEAKTAELTALGMVVYSPIVHFHALALKYKLPTKFEFWRDINYAMLDAADGLFVLTIDGWQESTGVMAEIDFAERANLSLLYVAP